jgi:hypothetical protein
VQKLEDQYACQHSSTDSIPFVQSQFNEAMDKTVTEARAEVEAFVDNKIRSLGIQALEGEVQKALYGSERVAPFSGSKARW